jgi:ferredoxin
MALAPEVSGNTINGEGERQLRRATPIYWHDPDSLPHGAMQKWFFTQDPDNAAINRARAERAEILQQELSPVSGAPLKQSAKEWSNQLRNFADTIDLELLGITRMRPEWTFEGVSLTQRWVIMIGVAHEYASIRTAPKPSAGAEVIRQYGRGIKAAKDIASWIRRRGWDAEAHGGPMAGPMLLIPPAIACGFGELGKHGSIINAEYGSSFRLAAVLTDIPLESTPSVSYGVDDFCSRCQVCTNACPPDAIRTQKEWVRGERKWYVDFDKCIPFFNENFGCGICVAICPWSIPGRGPRIVEQLAKRLARMQNVN